MAKTLSPDIMQTPFGRLCDRVLTFLDATPEDERTQHNNLSRMTWDGADLLVGLSRQNGIRDESLQILTDVRERDLSRPLDMKMISSVDNDKETRDIFVAQRVRRVSPKNYRGRTRFVVPNMVEWSTLQVDISQENSVSNRTLWGEIRPHEWRRADIEVSRFRVGSDSLQPEWASRIINTAHGLQFTQRYEWRLYLAYEGAPGISMATDPVGVRTAFRMRDLPPGATRRAALRHWVEAYERRQPSSDEDKVWVRKHLRGKEEFRWGGLVCRVTPPEFDLEKEGISLT